MNGKRITCLSGGVGGSKLVEGLYRNRNGEKLQLRAIVNVGDDSDILGLRLCPDIDILTYTLAGIVDELKGWGIKNDTFNFMSFSERLNAKPYLMLGDADLAVSIYRTWRLSQGATLSSITKEVARLLGVDMDIAPATNGKMTTMIFTSSGWIPFEEYFVKYNSQPDVLAIRYEGSGSAEITEEAKSYLDTSDALIICPSNPIASIGPILAIGDFYRRLTAARAFRIAVTPIVGGRAIKGPADRMMRSLGIDPSPVGVCRFYLPFIDAFVLDVRDEELRNEIESLGVKCIVLDTLMHTAEEKEKFALKILKSIEQYLPE
ncbi:MAG: 2-phospho-L-lactate transferase [Conexivisphaerales archaeon]